MSNCCGKLLVEVTGLTRSAWSILATLLLILLIFAIYSGNIEWRPAISDSIGYLQASHQLAKGEGLAFHDNHNLYKRSYFTLFAFNVSREGEANAYFSFPPGYPLLLASFERYVGSPSAAFYVGPFSVVGMVAATCGLGRRWFGGWTGFWAGVALVSSGVLINFGTSIWSEAPSAAFLMLGLYLYVRACDQRTTERIAVFLSGLAGLLIGITFFFRFSNVTVLPVMLYIGWRQLQGGGRVNRVLPMLGLVVLMFGVLLLFNTVYYGGPTITGYSPRHGWYTQPPFSLNYALEPSFANGRSLVAMLTTFATDFSWLLVFAGIALFRLKDSRVQWLLLLSSALLAPYTIYAFAPAGINARFVIPALPLLSLLIGVGIQQASSWLRWPSARWKMGLVMIAILTLSLLPILENVNRRNLASYQIVEYVLDFSASTSPNAVFMSYNFNDVIAFYANRSVLNHRRMPPYDAETNAYLGKEVEPILVESVERLLRENTPVYYVLDDSSLFDADEILGRHFQTRTVSDATGIIQVMLEENMP